MQQGQAFAQVAGVPFALALALVDAAVINYSTSAGAKLYKAAVEPLTATFDCQARNLKVFLAEVHDKAMITGW